ncbi:MAG: response regulator [Deltaproteobacteria bacterium]|nr:response regulator [Deltaproteobacteria bacterium]MBW1966918.1 response regulator [Deltaproteobacteria bacterium]MBW2098426.1 response regulator [Deltaproteobacteria bacterium]PXF52262.1 MAG: two-component system response regulator [Deltaproteobacteria bacterium]RKX57591.1 MAG: response regulator [Thermodesulfobacteriota bacterium]
MERKRILIADDEKVVRILLSEVLKPYGYKIDIAEDGVKAIEYINKNTYDLVITDYKMPKMDGLELTRHIRSKYPSTPILIVTGNGPVHQLLESGATACITKPFNILELENMVKIILNN